MNSVTTEGGSHIWFCRMRAHEWACLSFQYALTFDVPVRESRWYLVRSGRHSLCFFLQATFSLFPPLPLQISIPSLGDHMHHLISFESQPPQKNPCESFTRASHLNGWKVFTLSPWNVEKTKLFAARVYGQIMCVVYGE